MPDLVGYDFGRYHSVERLGQGGMATVYKAYDTRLDRDVAIAPDEIEQMLKRFDREAKSLAHLDHPNMTPIYDYGEQF
jgi:eukaryotic-like serine/threonine-protein kinase